MKDFNHIICQYLQDLQHVDKQYGAAPGHDSALIFLLQFSDGGKLLQFKVNQTGYVKSEFISLTFFPSPHPLYLSYPYIPLFSSFSLLTIFSRGIIWYDFTGFYICRFNVPNFHTVYISELALVYPRGGRLCLACGTCTPPTSGLPTFSIRTKFQVELSCCWPHSDFRQHRIWEGNLTIGRL